MVVPKKHIAALLLTCIVASFSFSKAGAPIDIQTSEAVKTVLRQTEQTFVKPGYSINQVSYNDPIMFATFLGLTMQRQNIYLDELRDVEDLQRMTALGYEIMDLLSSVAEFLEYKNPADGSPLSAEDLRSTFLQAFSGDYNQMFIEQGFDPTKMNVPYIISQMPLPPQAAGEGAAGGDHGRLQLKKPTTEIDLLGESAPAAETNTPAPYVGTPPPPEPVPISESCQCAKTSPGSVGEFGPGSPFPLELSCGNGEYLICRYFEDGRLASQDQYLVMRDKSKRPTGTQLYYNMENGTYYLRKKNRYDMNGEPDGVWEGYEITQSGQVYLASWSRHDHGQLLETKGFRMQPNYGHFMYSHQRYNPATRRMESVKR